jgi:cyanophycinase
MSLRLSAAGCLLLTLMPARADAQNARAGRLVIIGGGLSRENEAVYRATLAGRSGNGPFCIFPTAGANPEEGMASPVAAFERYAGSGTAKGILVSAQKPETAHDPEVVAQIRTCSGFFFIGGQQSRIVNAFRPGGKATPAYEALMQRWREGAVVSGSSAGAAIMSDPMIAGGSSAGSVAHGVRRDGADAEEETDGPAPVRITPGLGFFPGLADQHFLARGRIGRLIVAVDELSEFDLGFGIDENTALVVDGDSVHTSGASGVVIIDARGATRNGRNLTGIRLHLLGAGDRFHLPSRALITRGKTPLPTSPSEVSLPEDVFERWAFLHLLHQFSASTQREITVPIAGGQLVLRKSADFAAHSSTGTGVQNTPAGLTITGLTLELRRTSD